MVLQQPHMAYRLRWHLAQPRTSPQPHINSRLVNTHHHWFHSSYLPQHPRPHQSLPLPQVLPNGHPRGDPQGLPNQAYFNGQRLLYTTESKMPLVLQDRGGEAKIGDEVGVLEWGETWRFKMETLRMRSGTSRTMTSQSRVEKHIL